MIDQAVTSGKISAAQVAERTFDAIQANQFYIYSDLDALHRVRTRMEDILLQRNPGDSYQETPQLREKLQAKLKRGSAGIIKHISSLPKD